jgi:hypothetical protein
MGDGQMDVEGILRRTSYRTEAGAGDMDVAMNPWSHRHVSRPYPPWSLSFLRIHFRRVGGSGDAVADLQLVRTSVPGQVVLSQDHDVQLYELANAGVGGDQNLRVPFDELQHWFFGESGALQLVWTSPDGTNIRWGVEMAMIVW